MVSILTNQKKLSGVLQLPEQQSGQKVPLVIFLHGFIGSKVGEHRMFVKAARYFTQRGYAVFRFDFSGCGESDGDYKDVTVSQQLKEVQAVLHQICTHKAINPNEITLIGHSLGGAIASITAAVDTRIQQLILWSAVGTPYEDITDIIGPEAVEEAKRRGVVDYKGFYVSANFLEDLKNHQPIETISQFGGPAFILHAEEDEDVPKIHTAHYVEALQRRKTHEDVHYHYIKEADHTFTSYQFEQELFDTTANWLNRHNVKSIAL